MLLEINVVCCIREKSIIGTGSVVTKNVETDVTVIGSPEKLFGK